MLKNSLLFCLLLQIFQTVCAATCTNNQSQVTTGNWSSTGSWSCNAIPGASGETTITILSGSTITVDAQFTITGSPVNLIIYGTLNFANGKKLTLPTGSTIQLFGGSITSGGGGGSNNLITIGTTNVWATSDGNLLNQTLVLSESCTAPNYCTLPLTLLSFDVVSLGNNEVEISWTTSNESNINYLTLQRSPDGIHWENITNVSSQNNKSLNSYNYIDSNPLYGTSYYRLKETDNNGATIYYEVKAISSHNENLIIDIVPNPSSTSQVVIICNLTAEITIYDMMGKLILSQQLEIGKNIINLKAPSGTYVVKAITADGEKNLKLIIQ